MKALEYMHTKNIIHRDLKPLNILLDKQKNVVLGGFGTLKEIHDINTRTVDGTPSYMAPELKKLLKKNNKDRTYSLAVDVWSLAVILY